MSFTVTEVDAVFSAAIELRSAEQRAEYVQRVCGENAELCKRVQELLAAHFDAGDFLERPRAVPDGSHNILAEPGTVVGPYKLRQQIGEGGMGVVFLAEQTAPIQRTVALKIIKPGMDTRQVIARFEAERQALAMMDHPNIARVIDAGTTEAARPYFVMDLVKGLPITDYCDRARLGIRQRLELTTQVCYAVQHAHQKGIIHRDLKPTNILVADYDGQPVPKVIDFGVAKATAQKLTERTMFTEYGQLIGTFEYMSPEQARFSQLDIDTRSDIYSLGVVLYELLTGATPLDKDRLRSAAFDEILRMISDDEPLKPSTRLNSSRTLAAIAANRQTEPFRLAKVVRGELDWIVMKCLEKERDRRYPTAAGLASDIERYLSDEQVHACPPSASYRFQKLVRRNLGAFIASTATAMGLLIALVALAISNMLIRAEQARTESEKLRAEQAHNLAEKRAEHNRQELERLQGAISALDRGRVYTEWTRWDDADAAFTSAISLRPDLAPVWAERGKLFATLGLWDMAAADFAKLHEIQAPALSRDWWHCAVLLAHTGDHAAFQGLCNRMWERFAGTNATSFTIDLARTLSLMPTSDIDPRKVVSLIEEANSTSESDAHGRFALVIACYRAGDFERAAQEGESLAASSSDGSVQSALPVLAMAYQALGRKEEARQLLDKASEIVEQSRAAVFERKSPNWVVDQGVMDSGSLTVWDWLEFLQYVRQAQALIGVSQHREDARPGVARARALAGLRRFVQADHEYANALRLAPDAIEIRRESHRNRGYVFASTGDFPKSAKEFGKASALDPTDSDLWRFYAAALAASNDAAAYKQVCRDMIRQFGNTTDRAQAYDVTHACVLIPDAVPETSQLTKLAELASTWYVGAKRIQGAAYYRAGRYEEALSLFSGAEKGQRFRAFDMCFVAMAQQRLGNRDASRRLLAQALAWIEAADAQDADDLTGLQPHWGHWHERMDVYRLAEEARRLIEETPHSD